MELASRLTRLSAAAETSRAMTSAPDRMRSSKIGSGASISASGRASICLTNARASLPFVRQSSANTNGRSKRSRSSWKRLLTRRSGRSSNSGSSNCGMRRNGPIPTWPGGFRRARNLERHNDTRNGARIVAQTVGRSRHRSGVDVSDERQRLTVRGIKTVSATSNAWRY
jgi:hypothetical protein